MYCISFIAKYFIVLQLVLLPNIIWAQVVAQSPDVKLSGQIPYVCIGKHNGSTVICMQQDNMFEIKKYNDAMAEISRIDVPSIPTTCKQLHFIKQSFTYQAYYQINTKQQQQLYVQNFDTNFKPIALAQLVATVGNNTEPLIKSVLVDNKKSMVFYYSVDSANVQYVYVLQTSIANTNTTWQCIALPENANWNDVQINAIYNKQIIVTMHTTANNGLITGAYIYTILDNKITETIIPFNNQQFNYQIQQMDANNQQLVWCFLNAADNAVNHYSCTKIIFDARNNSLLKNNFLSLGKYIQKLNLAFSPANFLPRQLVIAKNGDVVLTTEYVDKQDVVLGSDMTTGSIGAPFRITRHVKKFLYNDILVYKISNLDTIDWVKNISKQQISENDEGAYSSFVNIIRMNNLSLLFNALDNRQTIQLADIYADGNINYTIINDDKIDAKNLVFKKAKQISNNEVLVPSIRQNIFSFVKIRF